VNKPMKHHLFIPWLVLLVLTTVGYVTRTSTGGTGMAALAIPLGAAAIKLGVVAWVFMELRSVSRYWAVGTGLLLVAILGMIIILQLGAVANP
jgi:hypothetical protein